MLENSVTSSGCVFQTFAKQVVWSSSQILSDEAANSVAPTESKIFYSCHFTIVF